MKYVIMPKTELNLSVLINGTSEYGTKISATEALKMLDNYAQKGGNCLDTANVYGRWGADGDNISEKIIGQWLKANNLYKSIKIITKGAHPPLNDMQSSRLNKKDIMEDLNSSLEALGKDKADIYFLHRDDERIPVSEIIDIMEELVQKGYIGHYGCSNWCATRIFEAILYAKQKKCRGFAANQLMYSLAKIKKENIEDKTMVAMDDEFYVMHQWQRLTAFAYGSQAKGFFTKLGNGELISEKANARFNSMGNLALFGRMKQLSIETGYTITQIALGALYCSTDFCTFPIIGSSNISQHLDSMTASDVELTKEQLNFLNGEKPFCV